MHYPTQQAESRIVWGRFGVRLEAATEALMAEVRVQVPPRLVHSLLTVELRHGSKGYWLGCRCEVCRRHHRDDAAQQRARKRERRRTP